jgi:hypothetical protein
MSSFVARLLADHHHFGGRAALAEDGLRTSLVQIARGTALRRLAHPRERGPALDLGITILVGHALVGRTSRAISGRPEADA